MERLTSPTLKQNFKHCVDAWSDELLREEYWKLYDRLAAYEDTGLTPEEVNACKHALMGREIAKITEFEGISLDRLEEICNAERDGRCVVLPCKVGDTLYLVLPKCRASKIPIEVGDMVYIVLPKCRASKIPPAECNFFECDGCPPQCNKREIFEQKATTEMLSMMLFEKYNTLYVFGKTVFLTREEAEAALKECENNG